MKIGAVIKSVRESKHLSRQELSDRAGISRVYLWQIEMNRRKVVTLDVFAKIAKGLGMRASKLLAQIEHSAESNN